MRFRKFISNKRNNKNNTFKYLWLLQPCAIIYIAYFKSYVLCLYLNEPR